MTDPAANAIVVEVTSAFIPAQSDPAGERYVFSYTVTITNRGTVAARLMTRHWIVSDGDERVQEIRGDGVIGKQPRIEPGTSFRYSSGTVLATPVGSMRGSYQMLAEDGTRFDAEIAMFTLAAPRAMH